MEHKLSFPYYEIKLSSRKISEGKFVPSCSIRKHTGSEVAVIQPRWDMDKTLGSKDKADAKMRLNAMQYLRRHLSLDDDEKLENVVIK